MNESIILFSLLLWYTETGRIVKMIKDLKKAEKKISRVNGVASSPSDSQMSCCV